jgi:hypothetical protein
MGAARDGAVTAAITVSGTSVKKRILPKDS